MKTLRVGLFSLSLLLLEGELHRAFAATECLSITGTTATPVPLGTTLTFTATCCTSTVPALSGTYPWILGALLLLGGALIVGRVARAAALLALLGVAALSAPRAEASSCGGPFQWTAQSATQLFTGTGATFSFTPTAAGTFSVAVSDSTETATLSPPITVGTVAAVLQHHNGASRNGLYVAPTITKAVAATMHRDTSLNVTFSGNVYAQPLYVPNGPSGKGTFIVVTESNEVLAVAEADGSLLWTSFLGTPVSLSALPCGNINPLGITGTPAIDLSRRTVYASAVSSSDGGSTIQHLVYALSLDSGSVVAGWPVNVSTVQAGPAFPFNPAVQNQRGALLVSDSTLYVPYGGLYGDCGAFRGWVIGIPLDSPASLTGWVTPVVSGGGGIWAPSGPSSDGTSVFVATGNGFGGSFEQQESIVRLQPGPVFSGQTTDFFAPSNWHTLDNEDLDLGSSGALPVDVPGATPSQLVVAFGKNGVAYFQNRANLGGVGTGNGTTGEGLVSLLVATAPIINAPATYTTANGVYVVFSTSGGGAGCPAGQSGNLVALKIGAASPPTVTFAWCANGNGRGSPMVTTTDGQSQAVVWAVGAQGTNRLYGFDGDTGAVVFAGGGSGDVITGVQYLNSPIAANGRIVVAGSSALYAFTSP